MLFRAPVKIYLIFQMLLMALGLLVTVLTGAFGLVHPNSNAHFELRLMTLAVTVLSTLMSVYVLGPQQPAPITRSTLLLNHIARLSPLVVVLASFIQYTLEINRKWAPHDR